MLIKYMTLVLLLIITATAQSQETTLTAEQLKGVNTGKALATAGTVAWATGKVLEGVGIVVSMENEGPGLAMLFTGLALDFFGPLSSAIGEKVAKNAVGQDNRKGLNSTHLSGGATYGISWALVVVPVAGEVMRGVSAIAPLVRISRYQRQVATVEFDISPYVSIQTKKVGLSLSAAF